MRYRFLTAAILYIICLSGIKR
uniref:Uncharacterized protein n=1 Tax=Anguilla anguilla TaxID=7936 RepID=A0A0E9RVK1_ANGAN